MSVNKAILIGRLGQDPDVRYTPGGQAVANFSIATDESYTDKNGVKQEKTEWHRIVAWGRTGELAGQYLKKGREVYVEGRIETREWQDKDGNKRQTTEIRANNITFLSGGRGEPTSTDSGEADYSAPRGPGPGPRSGPPAGGGQGGQGGRGYGGPPQGGAPGGGGRYGGYDGPPQGGPPPGPQGPPGGSFSDDEIPF
ncbi:MAG: single-stranded DNA-binding protein [Planctomycetota bacterium]